MSDGWETRRRRGAGHDWVVIRLGAAGRVSRVEIDTSHFKGNAPGQCALETWLSPDAAAPGAGGAAAAPPGEAAHWRPLLPRTRLLPHAVHRFADELHAPERATHVRLHVYPDGGVARLRLWGRTDRSERLIVALGRAGALGPDRLREELLRCCASPRWAARVAEEAPYVDAAALLAAGDRGWRALGREDWLAAFAGHPRIGERSGGAWSQKEQAGASAASAELLAAIADGNRAYEERFGHIYIVCATGRSAGEMFDDLSRRLQNDPDTELAVAAEEQRKIIRLRLMKWLVEHPSGGA
jgi:allantoicase